MVKGVSAILVVTGQEFLTVENEITGAYALEQSLSELIQQPNQVNEVIVVCNGALSYHQVDRIEHFKQIPLPFKYNVIDIPEAILHRNALREGVKSASNSSIFAINAESASPEKGGFSLLNFFNESLSVKFNGEENLAHAKLTKFIQKSESILSSEKQIPFSVLMSTYAGNDAAQLNQALLSILYQNTPPKEVVLVLDGPIPTAQKKIIGSFELAQSLGSLPFDFILVDPHWKQSRFLAAALNEGLKHCSQAWVARMDSDDVCLPNRLSQQWAAIQFAKAKKEDYQVVCSSVNYFQHDPVDIDCTILLPQYHKALSAFIKDGNNIYHPTVVFDRDFINDLGAYNTSYKYLQDMNLWQRALEAHARFHCIQSPLLNFRVTEDQHSRREKSLPYLRKCFQRACDNGWISESKSKISIGDFEQSVASDFTVRKIDRRQKYHISLPENNMSVPNSAVIKNASIDPENPKTIEL